MTENFYITDRRHHSLIVYSIAIYNTTNNIHASYFHDYSHAPKKMEVELLIDTINMGFLDEISKEDWLDCVGGINNAIKRYD